MPIDQSKLGQHIQDQMETIENDPDVPDDAEIGAIITIVELGKEGDGAEQEGLRNLRVRTNVPPTIAIGLMEEAKAIQLGMLGGGNA
jgi:hypothetical protein